MQAAGLQLRPHGQSCAITCAARYGDLTDLVNRYVSGETMKKVSKDSGVNSKQIERAVVAAGHVPRTLLQAVGLRYTNMNLSEKRSLTAKANIAKRGKRASKASQERRARTMEVTLQLASRTDLMLSVWLAQRGVKFTPQKAIGSYNIDVAIDELLVAVEVNGDWHYFPDVVARERERREYLFDAGWRIIDVALTSTCGRPWKYLRPACADKIVALLDELRTSKATWGKHCVIGGDGEFLTGEGS
jgi:very-short-patch-repair endonuclease